MVAAPARPRTSRRGLALRLGVAASLVVGVAAALPSSAAEAYTDTDGFLEVPAVGFSAGDLAYDFATCPAPPPTQGVDVWAYELPADLAVAGAPLTVTGADAAGAVDLFGYVYKADCTYDRLEESASAEAGLAFPLAAGDRFLTVATPTGVGTDLTLTLGAAAQPAPTASAAPTAPTEPAPGPGTGGTTRRDYSGPVNDPYYRETEGLLPIDAVGDIAPGGQWGMRVIRAAEAWKQPQATGAGITVAVLDSGLDLGHEDFDCEGKIRLLDAAKYPRLADVTDTDGHGTHVAGIVGACTNNNKGVVGAAPDATILPIQALSPTDATADRLALAIRAATDSGAHVINMSLGFSAAGAPGSGSAIALLGGFADDIDPAIEYAVSEGVVVVAAAGNESFPICGYPALAEDVVCVGSTDRRDVNSWYGNFPVTPSGTALVAPGGSGQLFCDVHSENVLSTYSTQADNGCAFPAEGYAGLDGTSMAAPHVAGVAALVYDRLGGGRTLEAGAQVVAAMVEGAKDLYTPDYDPMSGEGRVDALGAVRAVTPVTSVPTGTATPTPTTAPEQATTLELVAPATGQTTDALPVSARVQDASGRVAGAPVTFRLAGEGGAREARGVTGEDGVVTTSIPLDLAPGAYQLSATYAGEPGTRSAAGDDQPVQVLREDSSTTLTVQGSGSKRTLTVALADADTASRGIGGAPVALFADGEQVGTVTTDDTGAATFAPTGRARSASSYEARFEGSSSYTGSAGRATA